MAKIIALVGMPGSGKSAAAKYLKETLGFPVVRLGDLTERTLKEKGLELNEQNERLVREELRKKHGMDVFAKLNIGLIEDAAKKSPVVVIDGLYSTEEYKYFGSIFNENLAVIAIYAPPKTRYLRLAKRKIRPLTEKEAKERDFAELENSNKGGPIAMADYTIANTGALDFLENELKKITQGLTGNR